MAGVGLGVVRLEVRAVAGLYLWLLLPLMPPWVLLKGVLMPYSTRSCRHPALLDINLVCVHYLGAQLYDFTKTMPCFYHKRFELWATGPCCFVG